jgi:uncharacterized protein (TIGR02246 family)
MPARTPAELDRLFIAALEAEDPEALLVLYEPGASLVTQPGQVVTGVDAIRAASQRLVALKMRFSLEPQSLIEAGEVALKRARWTGHGINPDGTPFNARGVSAEVVRRQPDGSWRYVIDDPFAGS